MHMFVRMAIFRWFDKVRVFGADYLLLYGFKDNAPNQQQVEAMLPIGIHFPFIDDIVPDQNSDVTISNCQVLTITNYQPHRDSHVFGFAHSTTAYCSLFFVMLAFDGTMRLQSCWNTTFSRSFLV